MRLLGRRRLADGDDVRVGRTHVIFANPAAIGIGPTLVPGELSATPRFSDQQQRLLQGLCRPLLGDGEGTAPASDEQIAGATGTPVVTVTTELDHLTRMLGLDAGSVAERRRELALLAVRSGLVASAEDDG
jgi:hypothetical protein